MNVIEDEAGEKQFSVEDVCDITGIRPYVVRFWETEFETIRPAFGQDGQKYYSQSDVDLIREIKKLLRDDNLTIEKVKQHFHRKNGKESNVTALPTTPNKPVLQEKIQNSRPQPEFIQRPVVAPPSVFTRPSPDAQMLQKLNRAKEKLREVINLTRE
jgi:DNA-binding transcriptional MerR regulator